jgi:hypothetical protein
VLETSRQYSDFSECKPLLTIEMAPSRSLFLFSGMAVSFQWRRADA